MSLSNHADLLIIGAGISGVSAAVYAKKKGIKVTLLEAMGHPGGIIDTLDQSDHVEFGAHSIYNSYKHLLELVDDSHYQDQVIAKAPYPFKLYENGQLSNVFKRMKKLPLAFGMLKWYILSRQGKTVGQHYRKVFGQYNYDHVLKHCFNAVLSQNAENFPADLLFNVKKRNKQYPRAFSFRHGMSAFINHLIKHYHLDMRTSRAVNKLELDQHAVKVTAGAEYFTAKQVLIATDNQTAGFLLKDYYPEIAQELTLIYHSSIISCAFIVEKDSVDWPKIGGAIGIDADFYSIVSADPFAGEGDRGFTIHFKYQRKITADQLINKVCRVMSIQPNDIKHFRYKIQSVPQLQAGHKEQIKQVDEQLQGTPLALSGNYFNRLAVEDCMARSKEVVEQLVK